MSRENKRPYLSIVIPAYNEEQRLPGTLAAIRSYLKERRLNCEVLVVSDGSQDKTAKVVRAAARRWPQLKVIENKINRGKGAVVRDGVLAARGRYVLVSDADNATPIEELDRLLPFSKDFPIVIGSRHKPGARIVIKQSPLRILLSRLSNLLIRWLLLPGIWDSQCGFKLFEAEVARTVFTPARIERFGWDFEILAIAREHGWQYFECPITWYDDAKSKVRAGRDSLRTLVDLIKVSSNMARGYYLRPVFTPAPRRLIFK